MSWTQGIQVREDVSRRIIEALEDKYFELNGVRRKFEYLVWDDTVPGEVYAVFNNGVSLKITKKDDA